MEIKATESSAFDIIYEDNVSSVYHTALRYSGNHHTAEEITQTVFMKLYMNREGVNEYAVGSWLVTAAKHIALNYKRGLKREVLKDELPHYTYEALRVGSPEEDFIENLYKEEYRELAEEIFADLYDANPKWNFAETVICLIERTQQEVAETMGLSLEALHSMLYRAKKWIRKNYKEKFDRLRKE